MPTLYGDTYYINQIGRKYTPAIGNVKMAISYKVIGQIPFSFTK